MLICLAWWGARRWGVVLALPAWVGLLEILAVVFLYARRCVALLVLPGVFGWLGWWLLIGVGVVL